MNNFLNNLDSTSGIFIPNVHNNDENQTETTGLSYSPSLTLDNTDNNALWKQMTSSSGLPRESHFGKNENAFFRTNRSKPNESPEYTLQVVPSAPSNDFEFEQDEDPMEQERVTFTNSPYQSVHYQACMHPSSSSCNLSENVNALDSNGNSALMWAVNCNNLPMIKNLVSKQAFINHQNNAGETALYLACARGYLDCVVFLCEHGASFNIVNIEGSSCAHISAANGHVLVLEYLLSLGCFMNLQDEAGDTSLHWAVRENQPDCVRFLVEHAKVNIQICNEDDETPRQLASCLGETLIAQFLGNWENSQNLGNQFSNNLHF